MEEKINLYEFNHINNVKITKINSNQYDYETIFMYFDGSFSPNQPNAGTCCFIENDGIIITGSVNGINKTNNRAEISALISGLKYCQLISKKIKTINIFGDSLWAMNSVLNVWKGKKNLDLINFAKKEISKLKNIKINFYHVRGHTGINGNEICDQYSKLACV
jgi:ribonuclease HI